MNYCCEKLKEIIKDGLLVVYKQQIQLCINPEDGENIIIEYCPFCGKKLELETIK
jgi:hypothetical protein